MLNLIQKGCKITITAPAGGLTSGQLVKVGDKIFAVEVGAVEGGTATCVTEGVIEAPKAAVAIAQGALVYFDAATKVITNVATNNTFAGYAFAAAAAGDSIVLYRIK